MVASLFFRSLLRKTATQQRAITSSSVTYRFLSVEAASFEQIIPGVGKGKTNNPKGRSSFTTIGTYPNNNVGDESSISFIIQQIHSLHIKNQEIMNLVQQLQIQKTNDTSHHDPYCINTKIVAKYRVEISKDALQLIHDPQKNQKQSMQSSPSSSTSKLKKQNELEKVVKNAERYIIQNLHFGTAVVTSSLEELIEQSEYEIQFLKSIHSTL